jgi:alpha-1,2-mannosyltransferase
MASSPTTPKQDRLLAVIACGIIALTFALIANMVLRKPFDHNECPIYLRACWDWWAGRGLYDKNFGIDGFLYLPQFVLLFSPFALADPVLQINTATHPLVILAIGDCLWRAAGLALFIFGIWRAANLFAPQNRLAMFNLLFFISFPPAIASLRNGQANLHIAALMLMAAADLAQKKWTRATAWLVIGFFIKPVMAVMILLAAVGYRKMPWRLGIGLVAGFGLPFAFQKPHYVIEQYRVFYRMTLASSTPDREFCNLHGLLAKFSLHIPPTPFQLLALAAAAATLVIWLYALRREEPFRAFFLFALSAGYVLLFNFRTESNSYVMLAPAIAIAAALALFRFYQLVIGWLLIAIAFCMICDAWAYHQTENWLKPLACLVFLAIITIEILRNPHAAPEPFPAESMAQA